MISNFKHGKTRLGTVIGLSVMLVTFASCSGPGGSRTEQSEAERLFRDKCQTCHRLPSANDMAPDKWPLFLNKHAKRAGLDSTQLALLERYLAPPTDSINTVLDTNR